MCLLGRDTRGIIQCKQKCPNDNKNLQLQPFVTESSGPVRTTEKGKKLQNQTVYSTSSENAIHIFLRKYNLTRIFLILIHSQYMRKHTGGAVVYFHICCQPTERIIRCNHDYLVNMQQSTALNRYLVRNMSGVCVNSNTAVLRQILQNWAQ